MIEFLIIVSIVLLDRLSNFLAINYLMKVDTVPIINDVFHLTYATNTGAAFSMFNKHTFVLGIVSALVVIFLFIYLFNYRKENGFTLYNIFISMILGGAIGNMIDRFYRGYVVDYFDFRLIDFAIFNIADSFVVVGTVLLCVYILFIEGKKEN